MAGSRSIDSVFEGGEERVDSIEVNSGDSTFRLGEDHARFDPRVNARDGSSTEFRRDLDGYKVTHDVRRLPGRPDHRSPLPNEPIPIGPEESLNSRAEIPDRSQ